MVCIIKIFSVPIDYRVFCYKIHLSFYELVVAEKDTDGQRWSRILRHVFILLGYCRLHTSGDTMEKKRIARYCLGNGDLNGDNAWAARDQEVILRHAKKQTRQRSNK